MTKTNLTTITANAASTAVREFFLPLRAVVGFAVRLLSPHAKPSAADYVVGALIVTVSILVLAYLRVLAY